MRLVSVSKRSEIACINKLKNKHRNVNIATIEQQKTIRPSLTYLLHVKKRKRQDHSGGTQITLNYNDPLQNTNANTLVWSYLLYTYNVSQRTVVHYLNHVHPLSNIKKALLTGDVVQQQHTIRPAEVRLRNAVEPEGGR